MLEHVGDREGVLYRVVRWLAPDGVLVLVNCASFPVFTSPDPTYRKAMQASGGLSL